MHQPGLDRVQEQGGAGGVRPEQRLGRDEQRGEDLLRQVTILMHTIKVWHIKLPYKGEDLLRQVTILMHTIKVWHIKLPY